MNLPLWGLFRTIGIALSGVALLVMFGVAVGMLS